MMKKIKWENILLFFLELLVNIATVGVAILLNALIDAAQISTTSGNTYYLQKTLLISILYAVCLGILIFLSNRYNHYLILRTLCFCCISARRSSWRFNGNSRSFPGYGF